MPKRTRSHTLETESRLVFQTALPSEWIIREQPHDYGVDLEVELTEENEMLSAQLFKVQLKATDKKPKKNGGSVKMSLGTLEYYHNLQLPVLLVYYRSFDQQLFYRWIHGVDLSSKEGQQSKTIDIQVENTINENFVRNLPKYISRYHRIRLSQFRLPIPVFVRASFDKLDLKETRLERAFIECMANNQQYFTTVYPEIDSLFQVKIADNHLTTVLSDLDGIGIGVNPADLSSKSIQHFEFFLALSIGSLLLRNQNVEMGAKLILDFHVIPQLGSVRGMIPILLPQMLKSERKIELLKQVNILFNLHKDDHNLRLIYNWFLLETAEIKDTDLHNEIDKAYRGFIDESADEQKSTMLYNYGSYLRSRGSLEDAIQYYIHCLNHSNEYSKRPYYYEELGGMRFETGDYEGAREDYEQAYSLQHSHEFGLKLADCEMLLGNYSRALHLIQKHRTDSSDTFAIFYLKSVFLQGLAENFGISDQERKPEKSMQILNDRAISDQVTLLKALEVDALNGLAWFNLGVASMSSHYRNAHFCFMACALIQTSDKEAWRNTIIMIINDKSLDLFLMPCLTAGYFYHGEDLHVELEQTLDDNGAPDEVIRHWRHSVQEMKELVSQLPRRPILRMPNKKGEMTDVLSDGRNHES